MFLHKREMVEMIRAMANNFAALFTIGLIAIVAGLAIILGHNMWSGGALPVIVTLIGWGSLIKGMLSLFLPQTTLAGWLGGPGYEQMYYLSPAISLALGLYLVCASSFATGGSKAG
jgi:hypothetical protein